MQLLTAETTHTDTELLRRVAGGDQGAFREFFDRYHDNVYGVAVALLKDGTAAKDIVQEVFVRLWQQRTQLTEKNDFKNFLFIVARNQVFKELRRKKRQDALIEQLEEYFEQREIDAVDSLLHKESTELIHTAVQELSTQQREVYLLSREKGWSRQEIADHLGISVATVKTHLSRALIHIRQHLERHAGNPVLLIISLLRALL